MILNPFAQQKELVTYAGTRILQKDFGLLGTVIADPYNKRRKWNVQALYAPLPGMVRGGVRAKLFDDKNFVTFINQMDLEVLIGEGKPGERCRWSREIYSAPDEKDFYGMCVDEQDLRDDLFDRELCLRGESATGVLLENTELIRRVHLHQRSDVEELHVLLWDADPWTGVCPDLRMETLERRWSRIERVVLLWEDA